MILCRFFSSIIYSNHVPQGAQHSEILNELKNEIFKACTGKTFFDQRYILRELYCTDRVFFRLLIEDRWKVYLRIPGSRS